jgi:uncharacterized membrane protein (UPF0182 family)
MRRRGLVALVVFAVGLLFVVPSSAGYYTDWLWFRELGYEHVFLRTLNAQALVFSTSFALIFLFFYLNFQVARRSLKRPQIVLGTSSTGRPIVVQGLSLSRLALPISLVVALILAISSANDWLSWLSFFNAVPFGDRDPLFNRDVAFYVFRLPVLQLLQDQAVLVAFLALIGCGLLYVLSGSFVLEPRFGVAFWPRLRLMPAARRHLALLGALIFGLMAWGAWLDIPQTLLTPATVVFGASYADVHARLPFLRVTLTVLTLGAGLSIWHGIGRRSWPIPLAVALYLVVSAAGGIYAALLQNFVVTPNEQNKEQPYILNNIAATRKAYALDRIDERELTGDASLTPKDIAANAGTIINVRLWDHQPLLQTFSQLQEIRTYYDFVSVDNDRYVIDGKYRQVMLSARELNIENLPNRSWMNERLTYTHGYGLTLGPVNQVTAEGLPVLYILNLPPVSTVNLPLDEPSIYFGELSSNYALVRTNVPEFDYPRGDDNVMTHYHGTGGVPIGGFFRRLLFALRFGTNTREPDHVLPEDQRAGATTGAFLEIRRRSVSGREWRTDILDPGRLYDVRELPVRDAVPDLIRRSELHPELGQDRHRRVQRDDDALPGGADRSDRPDDREHFPRPAASALRHAGGSAAARPVPRGDLPDSGIPLYDLSHDQPASLLQQRRPVAGAGAGFRTDLDADAALLHGHEAAG